MAQCGQGQWIPTRCILVLLAAAIACTDGPQTGTDAPLPVIRLTEIARVGQVEGPDELRFSRITELAVYPDRDEVYLVDAFDRAIRVFTLDGRFLRSFAGRGQGPGEFESNPHLALARDTLIVLEGTRMHLFAPAGQLMQTRRMQSEISMAAASDVAATASGWLMAAVSLDDEAGTPPPAVNLVFELDPASGPVGESLHRSVNDQFGRGILDPWPATTFAGEGAVAIDTSSYDLWIRDGVGAEPRRLSFDTERVPTPADVVEQWAEGRRAGCAGLGEMAARCLAGVEGSIDRVAARPIPDLVPVLRRVLGSSGARVLVERHDLRSSLFGPSGGSAWELVDLRQGRRVGRLELDETFEPMWLGDDQLWGVEHDDLDVPFVVGYRMAIETGSGD